jgi:hypothetical protein
MRPVSPVLLKNPLQIGELVFAKDQPQYQPLPAIRTDNGIVVSRWQMSWRERLRVLLTGSVWLQLVMGLDERGRHRPLTPSMLSTVPPTFQIAEHESFEKAG